MSINVEQLYTKYSPMVLRRCRALLHDEDAALDAMQETFVLVLRKQEVLTAEAPSSMLYTFATNVCLNQLRSDRRKPHTSDSDMMERLASNENTEEKALGEHFLERLMRTEDETTARIVHHLYVEKRTLKETAQQVRYSVSGIRQRMSALRKKALVLREL